MVCEACHIILFSGAGNKQIYDVNNCRLMTADLHKLFDMHLISINNDKKLVFAKNLLKDSAYIGFPQIQRHGDQPK